ncbi:MAG: hypothetical protein WC121_13575 [Candidatus Kapaibacterium sp.]
MKIIITILLLITLIAESRSETNDVNIYGSFPGYKFSLDMSLEYSILNYELLGIENTTYLKAGSSVFGFQGLAVMVNNPSIGIIHYFGTKEGMDIGINYIHNRIRGTNRNIKSLPLYSEDEEYLVFEIGYRQYYDNAIFRFTFTPLYDINNPSENDPILKQFRYLISASLGYSF